MNTLDWLALMDVSNSGCPEPGPDAFDANSWFPPDFERWAFQYFQGQVWQFHIEWGYFDFDLLPGSADENTYFDFVQAYRHLFDQYRTKNETARRAAREASKNGAIEADKEDTPKTPKKTYGILPPAHVEPAVQSIIFAYVRLVAYIIRHWMKRHLDSETLSLENKGQVALASLRFGKRITWEKIKQIDRKLEALHRQAELLNHKNRITLTKLKAIKTNSLSGKSPSVNLGEKQERTIQNVAKKLWSIRQKCNSLERKRRLGLAYMHAPKKPRGELGATIAEELFSEGLLKLVKLVPLLPRIGKRYNWDAYEASDHITNYLWTTVINAINDYRKAERRDRKRIAEHLVNLRRWKEENHNRITYYDYRENGNPNATNKKFSNRPDVIYNGNTRYIAQSSGSGVVELEEQEHIQYSLDHVCRDIKDRLLLTMKREGILAEEEIGVLLDLGVKQVSKRWWEMRIELEKRFELRRRQCWDQGECSKRISRDPEKRKLAEEVVASWQSPVQPISFHPIPAPHFLIRPAHKSPTDALSPWRA